MQFYLKGKDGYQPLTMANGKPVQPMLGFINQATALVDKVRNYELAGGKTPDTKTYADLEKESMGNKSANARAAYEQATKVYNDTMTNSPDNKAAVEAAYETMLKARNALTGAGEGYSALPGQTDHRANATIMLAPDFEREGNPYRPVRQAASPGAPAPAGPAPIGWQPPPQQPQGFNSAQTYPAREPQIPQGRPIPPQQASGAPLPGWGEGRGLPPPSEPVNLQPPQQPGWFNSGAWAPGNSSADQVLDYGIARPQQAPVMLPEPWGRGR
jgi:hypothetical protein